MLAAKFEACRQIWLLIIILKFAASALRKFRFAEFYAAFATFI